MPTAILILRGGITPTGYTKSIDELYNFGVVQGISVEPFTIQSAFAVAESVEQFDLLGYAIAASVEPFNLGAFVRVDSVEPFVLQDGSYVTIGTNSPAAPILGWKDR